MWLASLFSRRKPVAATAFSDFIRNASSAEKKKVYTEVMRKASERQNAVVDERKSASAESA